MPCRPSQNARQRWHEALDLDEATALVREGRADELANRLRTRLLPTHRRAESGSPPADEALAVTGQVVPGGRRSG